MRAIALFFISWSALTGLSNARTISLPDWNTWNAPESNLQQSGDDDFIKWGESSTQSTKTTETNETDLNPSNNRLDDDDGIQWLKSYDENMPLSTTTTSTAKMGMFDNTNWGFNFDDDTNYDWSDYYDKSTTTTTMNPFWTQKIKASTTPWYLPSHTVSRTDSIFWGYTPIPTEYSIWTPYTTTTSWLQKYWATSKYYDQPTMPAATSSWESFDYSLDTSTKSSSISTIMIAPLGVFLLLALFGVIVYVRHRRQQRPSMLFRAPTRTAVSPGGMPAQRPANRRLINARLILMRMGASQSAYTPLSNEGETAGAPDTSRPSALPGYSEHPESGQESFPQEQPPPYSEISQGQNANCSVVSETSQDVACRSTDASNLGSQPPSYTESA